LSGNYGISFRKSSYLVQIPNRYYEAAQWMAIPWPVTEVKAMNIHSIQPFNHKEQTYTTHSFTFKNVISDAQTLETILQKACPRLWHREKVYKGTKQIFNYIQS
jgi:hypothetical protein